MTHFQRICLIKLAITATILLYFIHPILPAVGSLVWLWSSLDA